MGAIQSREDSKGRVKYTAIIRLKGQPTQTATFERKTDAKIWIQQTETAIREGRYFKTIESKKHTLCDLIERFEEEAIPHRKDGSKIQSHLNWWNAKIGYFALSEVTPVLLAECREKLRIKKNSRNKGKEVEKTISAATVNRYMASLSIVMSHAVEWGWLDDNPFRRVKKMKEPRGRVRFLRDNERQNLINECKASESPHLYVVVIMALSTGARLGEIINLTWQEVDLKHRMIRLEHTKNGERRAIPLTGVAYDLIEKKSKVRSISSNYVFPSQDGRRPADIRDAWDAALKRAEINDFRFHDLRHTAASYLAMNGASLTEISAILGRKTLSMVKRYAHLTEQHTRGVLERMNEVQFQEVRV